MCTDRFKSNYQAQAFTLLLSILFVNVFQCLQSPTIEAASLEFGFNTNMRTCENLGSYLSCVFMVSRIPSHVFLQFNFKIKPVLRMSLALAIVSCLSTYFIRSYPQLLLCRFATGIGVAISTVSAQLILNNLCGKRHSIKTAVFLTSTFGVALGIFVAGNIGPTYGWRIPFLVAAAPCAICMVAACFLVDEPSREDVEESSMETTKPELRKDTSSLEESHVFIESTSIAPLQSNHFDEQNLFYVMHTTALDHGAADEMRSAARPVDGKTQSSKVNTKILSKASFPHNLRAIGSLLSTPSIVLIFLTIIPSSSIWALAYVFLIDYLSSTQGLNDSEATSIAVIYILCSLFGYISSAACGERLRHRHIQRLIALTILVDIAQGVSFFYLLGIKPKPFDTAVLSILAAISGYLSTMNMQKYRILLQTLTFPEHRDFTLSAFTIMSDLFNSCSPVLVAEFCRKSNDINRQNIFQQIVLIAFSVSIVTGIVILRIFPSDVKSVNSYLLHASYNSLIGMEQEGEWKTDGIEDSDVDTDITDDSHIGRAQSGKTYDC